MTKAELEEEVLKLKIERDILKDIVFKMTERANPAPAPYYPCPQPTWPRVGQWRYGQFMWGRNQAIGDTDNASVLMNADNQLTTLSN